MPGYAATLVNPNTNPTDPDVPMFEISNKELQPPSPFHSPTHLDANHSDNDSDYDNGTNDKTDGDHDESAGSDFSNESDGDFDNGEHDTQDGYDEEDHNDPMDFGDDFVGQSLETIFHRSSQPAAAAVDLDTESEASDEEEESQFQSVSQPSGAQAGRHPHSVVEFSLMRSRVMR